MLFLVEGVEGFGLRPAQGAPTSYAWPPGVLAAHARFPLTAGRERETLLVLVDGVEGFGLRPVQARSR